MDATDNRVTAKLFIGVQVSPELRNALEKSSAWKLYKIEQNQNPSAIVEIFHQSKRYIGRFTDEDPLSLATFRVIEQSVISDLQPFIEAPLLTSLRCCVLSQLFIS